MLRQKLAGREIIVEFSSIGNVVKVTAMDVETLTEISIQGPANTHQDILTRNAINRLEYVLKKKGLISAS